MVLETSVSVGITAPLVGVVLINPTAIIQCVDKKFF